MPAGIDLKELLSEFQLKNFRLLYHDAADFTESPFFGVLIVLVYRFVFALYCFCWIIASGVHPSNGEEKWFIHLTNWSYFFLTLYFVSSAILTAIYYRGEWMVGEYDVQDNDVLKPKSRSRPGELNQQPQEDIEENFVNPLDLRHEEPVHWYHEAVWVIYNIAAANAIVITVLHWSFSYPKYPDSYTPDGLDISVHLLNTIFILVDVCLSCIPVRLYHVVYPMLFYFVYVIFTLIYWASDGSNVQGQLYIYSSLDYTGRPATAAGMVLGYSFIALVLVQLILFGLTKLRSWVSEKVFRGKRRGYDVNV